jgi:pseudaminic acid biosynthesis-associated methylase
VSQQQDESDITRLENLWSGDFGNAYIERNRGVADGRQPFWSTLLDQFPVRRVLEVGCNTGPNLRWLRERVPEVYGVDVSAPALAEVRSTLPDVNAVRSAGRDLPFRDGWFDLVFTMGVLIHQHPEALPLMMAEIVRCSRRYVLCGEYFSEEPVEVAYRGQRGALFKRDFGGLYLKLFPELTLRSRGFLGRDQGWDDVTWWIFEKPRG